ncbi:type II secretion system protein [Algisphaera agarilytica]|uniref:type II secretion system protein n=1 Tax=Algisphaera agarilytica TaxID=1385975 RepID=UPI0016123C4F|nr:type II secretion system protein [Algisphaera agarilytica]
MKTTRHRGCRGLTLVELMMALGVMGLISAAIAGMLSAVAYGTSADSDVRKLVARGKMVSMRLDAALRGSRMVLDAGSDWVALWERDLDENGEPSLLEVRLIEFDAATESLSSYTAPDGTTDVLYSTSSDFDAITHTLRGTADFPETRWGNDATAFEFTLDQTDPQAARLASYRLSLNAGNLTEVVIGTTLLRTNP